MSSTTAIHGLPVPEGDDAPAGPLQITELANAIDVLLPIVSETEPSSPAAGSAWFKPSTGQLSMYDGSSWNFVIDPIGTGWITAVSLASGWTQDSTPLQAIQIGRVVYLKGGVMNAAFSSSAYTAACSLPTGIDPPLNTEVLRQIPGGGTFGTPRAGRLLVDGTFQFATSAATSVAYRVDSCFYLV